jgi:putative DNA primase/helicase
MSSIATALKQGADKSRFAQLTLRNPNELPKQQRISHWEELERDLDRHISDAIAQRLQARTIQLIPVIRRSVRVFTRAAAEAFDSQRLGDQYGTLLAGAWSLMSTDVPTPEEARKLIADNDWSSYSQTTEVPDEQRCLERILQHQIRVEADRVVTRTVGELADIAQHHAADATVTPGEAQSVLGRNGMRAEGGQLIVSNTANAIAAILRDTAWVNCWPTVLARLPGARKTGAVRFAGAGAVSRAVALPLNRG